MPAFVNIRVGSFRETNGPDGTTVWSFLSKKSKKADRMSLTLLIHLLSPDMKMGKQGRRWHPQGRVITRSQLLETGLHNRRNAFSLAHLSG